MQIKASMNINYESLTSEDLEALTATLATLTGLERELLAKATVGSLVDGAAERANIVFLKRIECYCSNCELER
jgi:hypothetical protein